MNQKFKKLFIVILAILLLIAGYFVFFQKPEIAAADWWDDSWLYRQTVGITNSGTAETDFQVMITLDSATLITANKLQSDCDDIRLTDINGKLLNYWIEPSTCNTATTKIWTKVPSISTSGDTVYLYYGNSAVDSKSSTTDTFIREISGVQGAWDMDGTGAIATNDTLADSSGNTNTGTASNVNTTGMAYASSQYEQGVDFDGVDDYVDLSDSSDLEGMGQLTITSWVKLNDTNDDYGIKGSTSASDRRSALWFDNIGYSSGRTNIWSFGVHCNEWGQIEGSIAATTNWTYIVGVYTGSTLKLYINGIEDTGASINGSPSGLIRNKADIHSIGHRYVGVGLMNGSIDNTRIYNTALTSTEISDLYGTGGDRQGYVTTNYPNKSLIRKYSATITIDPPTGEERGPGPVAFWQFDEGYGQTANDSTINANNGTLGGGTEAYKPTWQTEDMCVSGKCLKFDGVDDYVEVTDDDVLDMTDAITIEAWVKYNEKLTEEMIVGKSSAYILHKTNNGAEHFAIYQGNYQSVSNPTLLTDADIGVWRHRVGTYDGQQYLKLYINGVLVNSEDIGNVDIATSAHPLRVGFISDWGPAWHFNGSIDSVKIYPYARTAAQIKADYASRGTASGSSVVISGEGKKSLSDGLVGYWKMDEANWNGTADEVVDSSGSGNDGVAVGATGKPTTGAGKFGNGGLFDGVDDYVEVADHASLDITDSITIATWVKPMSNLDRTIIGKQYGSAPWYSYGFEIAAVKLRGVISSTGGAISCIADSSYTQGEWYHLVQTYNGTIARLYINGIKQSDEELISGTIVPTNGHLYFGSWNGTGSSFNGSIDSVRIYNRALSPGEVRDLYNFAPGPVAHWKMDENVSGDGQILNDISGNDNAGTTVDGANDTGMDCTVLGKYGSACEFDGVDDYVGVTDSNSLDITNNFTIELWFKSADTSQSNKYFMEKQGGNMYAIIYEWVNDQIEFFALDYTGDNPRTSSQISITDTNWHHIVYSYNGSNWRGYKDGTEVFSLSKSFTLGVGTGDLVIGGANPAYPATRVNGSIDDVRIYNYARTQAQIMEDYSGGAGRKQSIGHWKFDEGYGTTANNSGISGSTLNGTLTNMASPATSASGWTDSGKIGKGLVFDGENDYVDVGNDSSLNPANAITLSAWINTDDWDVNRFILVKPYTSFSAPHYQYGLLQSSSDTGKIRFALAIGGVSYDVRSEPGDLCGTYHHIVGTYNGSVMLLYIDGVETVNLNISGSIDSYDTNLNIGRCSTFDGDRYDGSIDDVKIYNYALTEDDIRQEYNQGALLKLGSTGTDSSGNADDSQSREYCIPGDTSTCNPPVGRWDFNEGAGSTVNDISGNNNTGTWSGAGEHWDLGKVGFGGSFNGSSDYVNAESYTNIPDGNNDYTYITWINIASHKDFNVFFSLGCSSGTRRMLFPTTNVNGDLWIVHGVTDWDTGVNLNSNEWIYFATTWDGTTEKLYINGNMIASRTPGDLDILMIDFEIGHCFYKPVGERHFNGSIDAVRIYDYARTPAQIAWDYNRGKPVAHWKFDECQGGTAYDDSGNGNDGMITIGATGDQDGIGTCTDGDTTNAWYNGRSGKYSSGMSFDGADDYVDAGSDSSLDITDAITIAIWIKLNGDYTTQQDILTKIKYITSTNNQGYGMTFGQTDNEFTFYTMRNAAGSGLISSISLADDNWHYVVGTSDGTTKRIYFDGILDVSQNYGASVSTVQHLYIGAGTDGADGYFNGLIDEVKIYNYALTAEQIKTEYNGGAVYFR